VFFSFAQGFREDVARHFFFDLRAADHGGRAAAVPLPKQAAVGGPLLRVTVVEVAAACGWITVAPDRLLAMQKVEGSNPFSRLAETPPQSGVSSFRRLGYVRLCWAPFRPTKRPIAQRKAQPD
jgi:hypothetical protein